MRRILRNSAYCVGGGIGLLIIKLIFSGEDKSVQTAIAFDAVGYSLVLYGLLVFATFVVRRKWIFIVDMLMMWVGLPVLVLWFLQHFSA
jgi:hypothetical protein